MSDKRYFYITDEDYAVGGQNGFSKRLIWSRVHEKGMDIDTAITKPLQVQEDVREYVALAKERGIQPNTFYTRKYRGMDLYEAATKPVNSRAESLQIARSMKKQA